MAVKFYQDGSFHSLAGAKVYHNGAWVTLSSSAKIYLNNTWHYLGNASSGIVISDGATIGSGMYLRVSNGEIVNNITLNGVAGSSTSDRGTVTILNGGTATNINVQAYGEFSVHDGGYANNISVSSGGNFSLYGGCAQNILADSGAFLRFHVKSNTYAQGSSAGSAFEITSVLSGQHADQSKVFVIHSGGSAIDVRVLSGGNVALYGGAYASNIIFSSGGKFNINLSSGSYFKFSSGGTAFEITSSVSNLRISSVCFVSLGGGCSGSNLTVYSGGNLYVGPGGILRSADVNTSGNLIVMSGGTALNVISRTGANISVLGGTITYA